MAKVAKARKKTDETRRTMVARPAMERIYHIHEAVKDGRYPNCTKLSRELEVTRKTVQRDINFMREALKLPLCYDEKIHGYYYAEDVSDFPVFEYGARELAALFLARQALESVKGTQLENSMRAVFAKLTSLMKGQVSFSWDDLDRAMSRKPPAVAKRDIKVFGVLAEAVLKHRTVQFDYRKLGADRAERRRVQPYHLGEVDRCWYLIGFDKMRGALRTFAMPRMRAVKMLAEQFEAPEDFNGVAYLGTSFGVWTDASNPDFKQEVRIELKGYAARLAQERRWHPSQQVTSLNSRATRVEVCFEVGRLEELVRWTLSWGSQAKVLAPPELKRMVAEEVRLMGRG
jgi:proteasome accessory factor B